MCGRYRIKDTDELTDHLRRTFGIPDWVEDRYRPRYNISPGQDCPIVPMNDEGDVLPVPIYMRWGFVPFWEKSPKPKLAPINARSEEAFSKGMFRQAIQRRRCLIPADGFYEWQRPDPKTKIPFDIHLRGNRPFFMAGIYELATDIRPDTFLVFTTAPNPLMARIHDRMPAILSPEAARQWLEPGEISAERMLEFMRPYPAEEMEAVPISSLVNNPRNDGPELLLRVADIEEKPPGQVQGELF